MLASNSWPQVVLRLSLPSGWDYRHTPLFLLGNSLGIGKMDQLRVLAVLLKDLSSIPSANIRHLTTVYNSSSRGTLCRQNTTAREIQRNKSYFFFSVSSCLQLCGIWGLNWVRQTLQQASLLPEPSRPPKSGHV